MAYKKVLTVRNNNKQELAHKNSSSLQQLFATFIESLSSHGESLTQLSLSSHGESLTQLSLSSFEISVSTLLCVQGFFFQPMARGNCADTVI